MQYVPHHQMVSYCTTSKKDSDQHLDEYRPVALTSLVLKLLKKIIKSLVLNAT